MEFQKFLTRILLDLVQTLDELEVNFALIGGLAFSVLVEPRATVDVDFLITTEDVPEKRIVEALEKKMDRVIPQESAMRFEHARIWRIVGERDGKEFIVDFMIADTVFLEEVLKRKNFLHFEDQDIPIVTREDLYILKSISGRLQDRADTEKMDQYCIEDLDRTYIKKWMAFFDTTK